MKHTFNENKQNTDYTFAAVHRFYLQVLDSLIHRLFRENKYKRNALSQDIIIELEKKIKNSLKNPESLFHAAAKYREGSSANQKFDEIELKDLNIFSKQEAAHNFNPCKIEEIQLPERETFNVRLKEELSNGLNPQAMKMEDESPVIKHLIRHCFFQQQSNQIAQQANKLDYHQFLNCRIAGIYKQSCLKYSSKESKYQTSLSDTFLKYPDGQTFCDPFYIEIIKFESIPEIPSSSQSL